MKLVIVLDSLRSAHNVGSILRLADGLGVGQVFSVGITPHIAQPKDRRLPHVIERAQRQITKTSLGAEKTVKNVHFDYLKSALQELKDDNFTIVGLEIAEEATNLNNFKPPSDKLALIVGNEVSGLTDVTLELCDEIVMIKMWGSKKSLNVSSAAAIAVYQLLKLSTA